jgi:hypothetical protein
LRKKEPLWWGIESSTSAVASSKDLREILNTQSATADIDERPDDISYHVSQE